MGKALSKTNCCASDQFSSNFTFSADNERFSSYKDDEPVIEASGAECSVDYALPSIQLKLASSYVQRSNVEQEWPAALIISCEETNIDLRSGIDIVCIVETSYLTKQKDRMLRNSVEFLMSRLTGQDRISLIGFADSSKKVTPLTSMTYTGKVKTNLALQSLHFGGKPNLADGLLLGLSVLLNRRQINHQSFIVIFATGDDSDESTEGKISSILQEFINENFSVFLFGLGSPKKVLNFIAEETNGTCYFAKNENEWFKNLAFSCGVMESKVLSDVFVELKIIESEIPVSISKIYSENGENEFRLQDGLSGNSISAVFILKFLPFDHQIQTDIVSAHVQYKFYGVQHSIQINLRVPFVNASDNIAEIELDEEILKNFYRVKCADIMNEASILYFQNPNDAKLLLLRGSSELQTSIISSLSTIQSLKQDLLSSMHSLNTSEQSIYLRNLARNHWSQRLSNCPDYQNSATSINKSRLQSIFNII